MYDSKGVGIHPALNLERKTPEVKSKREWEKKKLIPCHRLTYVSASQARDQGIKYQSEKYKQYEINIYSLRTFSRSSILYRDRDSAIIGTVITFA